MSLYNKYRPLELSEFSGNESVVSKIESVLSRSQQEIPHVWLFTGPPGTGKTTLARIVAKRLGCSDFDMQEIDIGDLRGIDSVRDIRRQMGLAPLQGSCRVWILDECFAAGTLIETPNGARTIESLEIGDSVFNVNGTTKVERVFSNPVSLDRVVKLTFDNGQVIFTTKQHLFLTQYGWIEAARLDNKCFILPFSYSIMQSIDQQKEGKSNALYTLWERICSEKVEAEVLFSSMCRGDSETKGTSDKREAVGAKHLHIVQESVYHKAIKSTRLLWQTMCQYTEWYCTYKATTASKMRLVWGRFCKERIFPKAVLRPILYGSMEEYPSFMEGSVTQRHQAFEFITSNKGCAQTQSQFSEKFFSSDDARQSIQATRDSSKDVGNKTTKWDTTYLEGRTRRQWQINSGSAKTFISSRMVHRISNLLGRTQGWLSDLLQGGYRQRRSQDSYRSRWKRAPDEEVYAERFKKEFSIEGIRLACVEIYERRSNEESFVSVIGDQERDRGFVNFYDLQIAGHPSYFANGMAVHNCHRQTSDAQAALLKSLEDTPSHVYFMLATTDPQRLLKAILSRCMEFRVGPLKEDQLVRLLRTVVRKEGKQVPLEILKSISLNSLGHPRNALVLLDSVIALAPEQREKAIEREATQQNQVIDLCRALIKGVKWGDLSKILNGLKDQDPESTRRAVLGYCSSVLLTEDSPRAFLVIDAFKQPTYDIGWPGIVLAAYEAVES